MDPLQLLLSPPAGLGMGEIAMISFILGMMHGATPDEHTWPITFSYAIGKYSTKGGMKAGLLFSLGFTIQRAFLTTLGYMGLAYISDLLPAFRARVPRGLEGYAPFTGATRL